jgi:hypothetical protein
MAAEMALAAPLGTCNCHKHRSEKEEWGWGFLVLRTKFKRIDAIYAVYQCEYDPEIAHFFCNSLYQVSHNFRRTKLGRPLKIA